MFVQKNKKDRSQVGHCVESGHYVSTVSHLSCGNCTEKAKIQKLLAVQMSNKKWRLEFLEALTLLIFWALLRLKVLCPFRANHKKLQQLCLCEEKERERERE